MSGRPKQEIYLYDSDGKYLRKFESSSEFCRTFQFDDNLFSRLDGVFEFEDLRVAATYRIGREGIEAWRRYKKSVYTKKYVGRKIAETVLNNNKIGNPLELINLDGEVIATFKNFYFAKKLLKMTDSSVPNTKNFNEDGLKFRYVN